VAYQGDSYVLIVELTPTGVVSSSVHQYGSSNRPSSPHYADQAPLFTRHEPSPRCGRKPTFAPSSNGNTSRRQ